MYGTLLDQRVFESLVEKTMPIIWDHLVKNDVQLSVVSLPWFLSLYINSMPLIFAFRVLDVFFLEGPRVLFQVGLLNPKLAVPDAMKKKGVKKLPIVGAEAARAMKRGSSRQMNLFNGGGGGEAK